MRFAALATDYDETLADHGRVLPGTEQALERLRASGRKLLLVTGRDLADLRLVFSRVDLFHAVVAENGALLYLPDRKQERPLAESPPERFVAALRRLGVPLTTGRVIVATRVPHETTVLEEIKRQGLELQVIFNKGAVMVLPSGVNKGTGLKQALAELRLSPHNAVAVGDAENDHVFLSEAELGAAVANALPSLRERADLVLRGAAHSGVEELIDQMLADDLRAAAARTTRRDLLLGEDERGASVTIKPASGPLLFAGTPRSGKSTAAKGFVERLIDAGYQCCILDPEGDWTEFERMVLIGEARRAPTVHEVVHALSLPGEQVVVNLIAVRHDDRPRYFAALLPRIQELRASTGRPHWLVVDEAHHFLPTVAQPALEALPADLSGVAAITVSPSELAPPFLERLAAVLGVGPHAEETIAEFCAARGLQRPRSVRRRMEKGEAFLWREGQDSLVWVRLARTHAPHQRHVRKYADGELPPDRSFYFRGPEKKLNLRAHNLKLFEQLAEGVDDATWLHHLKRGDYSRWFRDQIKDEELAREVERIEQEESLSPEDSREAIRAAIDKRYTLPAGASEVH
ncbi:MAG TPA: HAD family hydrolase [Myxococcales bacterium]|jgi:hydroxymethylpyrimidine pyrophosphatase-like HAD family hydrolase|nr:HAD family hydrolase [Myxococcales bacterium]